MNTAPYALALLWGGMTVIVFTGFCMTEHRQLHWDRHQRWWCLLCRLGVAP